MTIRRDPCRDCGRMFTQELLGRGRPFLRCPECRVLPKLRPRTTENVYPCPGCGQFFRSQRSAAAHQTRMGCFPERLSPRQAWEAMLAADQAMLAARAAGDKRREPGRLARAARRAFVETLEPRA